MAPPNLHRTQVPGQHEGHGDRVVELSCSVYAKPSCSFKWPTFLAPRTTATPPSSQKSGSGDWAPVFRVGDEAEVGRVGQESPGERVAPPYAADDVEVLEPAG